MPTVARQTISINGQVETAIADHVALVRFGRLARRLGLLKVEGAAMAGLSGFEKLAEERHFDRQDIVLCVR
jgi:hypothetical protein